MDKRDLKIQKDKEGVSGPLNMQKGI